MAVPGLQCLKTLFVVGQLAKRDATGEGREGRLCAGQRGGVREDKRNEKTGVVRRRYRALFSVNDGSSSAHSGISSEGGFYCA